MRWFTTQGEINLCGHATLAAAHVIFEHLDYPGEILHFDTRFVGPLTVERSGEWLTLDFPAWKTEPVTPPSLLLDALGITECKEVRVARDYMVVLDNPQQVEALRPDINAMLPLGKMVCVTAPGEGKYDFVSRFFCPGEAVAEDPVTGSAHSMLIPYWAEKLDKTTMLAHQGPGAAESYAARARESVFISAARQQRICKVKCGYARPSRRDGRQCEPGNRGYHDPAGGLILTRLLVRLR